MDNTKGWRGVPIETLKQYLAQQPEHSHRMVVNGQGEVVEVAQTGNEPPTVVVQKAPED